MTLRPDQLELYLLMFLVGGPFFLLGMSVGMFLSKQIDWLRDWTVRKVDGWFLK